MSLPPFPLDDVSLLLLRDGCRIASGSERTSLHDTLEMLSVGGGSDPSAVAERIADDILVMRDAIYSPQDAIVALVDEVLRLREATATRKEPGDG